MARASVRVLDEVMASVNAKARGDLIRSTIFVCTPTGRRAPLFILPLVLNVSTYCVRRLIRQNKNVFLGRLLRTIAHYHEVFNRDDVAVLLCIHYLIVRVIIVRLGTSNRVNERGRALIGVVGVLNARRANGIHDRSVDTMVAVTRSILDQDVNARHVFLIFKRDHRLRPAHISKVFRLFRRSKHPNAIRSNVLNCVEKGTRTASAATRFLRVVMFGTRLKVNAYPMMDVRASDLILRLQWFKGAISIKIPYQAVPTLTMRVDPRLAIQEGRKGVRNHIIIRQTKAIRVKGNVQREAKVTGQFLHGSVRHPNGNQEARRN